MDVDEKLVNPLLEEKAQELFKELFCPFCTGQGLDESPTVEAKELRLHIRDLLKTGHTKEEVKHTLLLEYPTIMKTPAFNDHTAFLWMAPVIGAILVVYFSVRLLKNHGASNDPKETKGPDQSYD
jgi:cytochrome c-type biogenesis protein CcmH/NrfF